MKILIDTPCGKIQGILSDEIIAYKGIRYATANRFEYPKLVTSWDGIYDATKYGNCSYQARAFKDESLNPKKIFYYNEFRKGESYTYSEDCLFLNIWTPSNVNENDKLPVLIYIHGGGFTGGCGHELHFDGPIWPKKGIIGVTINYRLGPLGFIAMKELKDIDNHTGNYGLFDQLAAMTWVKNNISSFGGDPNNITIMGQSAGAMSVLKHCISPLTDGIFNKAIMLSGGGVSKLLKEPDESKYFDFWRKVMLDTGAKTIDEFKSVPVEVLFNSMNKIKKKSKIIGMISSPVIDGVYIKASGVENVKNNNYKKIPYIIGLTSEDIVPPVLNKMAAKWCSIQECNSYSYLFNHQLPGDDKGAWHSSDLWYWFGTLKNCWRPLTNVDYELSDKMTTYLTNFVKTGNPNSDDLIKWDSTLEKTKKALHLGNGYIGMKKLNKAKLWHSMLTNKAVGE